MKEEKEKSKKEIPEVILPKEAAEPVDGEKLAEKNQTNEQIEYAKEHGENKYIKKFQGETSPELEAIIKEKMPVFDKSFGAQEEAIEKEVLENIKKAKQAPFPDAKELNEHVFSSL